MKSTRKVGYSTDDNQFPKIIFQGKWITEKYGVKVGDIVTIKFEKNRIILQMKQK